RSRGDRVTLHDGGDRSRSRGRTDCGGEPPDHPANLTSRTPEDHMGENRISAPEKTRDGVRLAILNKRFEGVVRKMANTLLRTGRSGVLNTARDFSCCVVTKHHELLSAAECYPIHVLRGADLMSRAMVGFHPRLRRGD